jgi:hypothetical protein
MTWTTDIQDAYIARMAGSEKIPPRTKGNPFGRTKRAARKQAITRLVNLGYSAGAAVKIVNDAHDVFLREAGAKDDASERS